MEEELVLLLGEADTKADVGMFGRGVGREQDSNVGTGGETVSILFTDSTASVPAPAGWVGQVVMSSPGGFEPANLSKFTTRSPEGLNPTPLLLY